MSFDRYYPESLIVVYFKSCQVKKQPVTFDGLREFVDQVMTDKHINGIPKFKTIEEVFDANFK